MGRLPSFELGQYGLRRHTVGPIKILRWIGIGAMLHFRYTVIGPVTAQYRCVCRASFYRDQLWIVKYRRSWYPLCYYLQKHSQSMSHWNLSHLIQSQGFGLLTISHHWTLCSTSNRPLSLILFLTSVYTIPSLVITRDGENSYIKLLKWKNNDELVHWNVILSFIFLFSVLHWPVFVFHLKYWSDILFNLYALILNI